MRRAGEWYDIRELLSYLPFLTLNISHPGINYKLLRSVHFPAILFSELLSTIQTKFCPCFLVYCTTTKLNMTMRRRFQADFKAVALISDRKILLPFVKARLDIRKRKTIVGPLVFGFRLLIGFMGYSVRCKHPCHGCTW